ncbi:hypothetical protein GUJ93_ZPchr0009g1762 [Zizania palustris]|uniref:Heparan-alpha-glucosaminide N-acetyltransferase catalytic domain-containing protein n=1 Tax=Zizania palustris TaxID=103762 RepID=A0A8J5VL21_ZIZPA|nr:hypothetical protein GUJ93_ZPchr0009g1762 [Zizania palustris]
MSCCKKWGKILEVLKNWPKRSIQVIIVTDGPPKTNAPVWCAVPFEHEGILSSLSAVLSTIIGVHYGHVLVHMKRHIDRLKQWFIVGISLLALGLILHFSHAIPLNKQLYTFSYICVSAGAAGIVFCMFYFQVDVLNLHHPLSPCSWSA